MSPQTAFRCTDPAVVAAYEAFLDEEQRVGNEASDRAKEIGRNTGVLVARAGTDRTVVGLAADDPADPPTGWSYMKRLNKLYPDRRTKAGKAAEAWLRSIRFPSHYRFLTKHGMATSLLGAHEDRRGQRMLSTPGMAVIGSDLYVTWGRDVPDDKVTGPWERVPLSRYYAAVEARDAAENEAEVDA